MELRLDGRAIQFSALQLAFARRYAVTSDSPEAATSAVH